MVILDILKKWPQSSKYRIDLLYTSDAFDELTKLSIEDVKYMARILYTLNHQWESPWSLLENDLKSMTVIPLNFQKRINEIFLNFNNPIYALMQNYYLTLDLLNLIQIDEETIAHVRKHKDRIRKAIDTINTEFHIQEN
jgi:hypothetical protein